MTVCVHGPWSFWASLGKPWLLRLHQVQGSSQSNEPWSQPSSPHPINQKDTPPTQRPSHSPIPSPQGVSSPPLSAEAPEFSSSVEIPNVLILQVLKVRESARRKRAIQEPAWQPTKGVVGLGIWLPSKQLETAGLKQKFQETSSSKGSGLKSHPSSGCDDGSHPSPPSWLLTPCRSARPPISPTHRRYRSRPLLTRAHLEAPVDPTPGHVKRCGEDGTPWLELRVSAPLSSWLCPTQAPPVKR